MDTQLQAALSWLSLQQVEMEGMLGTLVAENSHTAEVARCNRVADMLRECFTMKDLSLEQRPSSRFGHHLVFHTAAPGRATLLVGHHDTVFPPGTFEGMRDDGALLRGPGVLDMKGGLMVVRFALRALQEAGVLHQVPLRVVSVADEEVGSEDSAPHLKQLCAEADAALVFEAGRAGDAIITQRKGTGSLTVSVAGKAAHAGNAHKDGINAIWALARFVDQAQQLTDHARGITVNVGKISGGMGKNTVPDQAEALVDFRFVDSVDGAALEQAFREAGRAAETAVTGARVEVKGGVRRKPLVRTPASVALMERYAQSARQAGLGTGEAALLGGGSDANTTSAAGVASIDGLGPRGKGFHTQDEQIERATLLPKAQALVRFLWNTRITG
jgi:glutamate carboxypeptidase